MGEAAALERPAWQDGGLVGDEHDLAAGELLPDGVDHGVDPLDHVDVPLPQEARGSRSLHHSRGWRRMYQATFPATLEDVARLDEAQVGADLEAVGGGDRGGRLLGPLQGLATTAATGTSAKCPASRSAWAWPRLDR